MAAAKSVAHTTTQSKVEVAKYLREVLDHASDSTMTVKAILLLVKKLS